MKKNNLMEYCKGLFFKFNNNLKKITSDSTKLIFELVNKPNEQLFPVKDIKIGSFYLIKYNYNKNKIWCPIFVIDDRIDTINKKRIIYSINIDYLPYPFRITFFNLLFDSFISIIDFNDKESNPKYEKSLPVNFSKIQNLLKKSNNHDYSITAHDFSKIEKINYISTNFVHRLLYIDTKLVNVKNMVDYSIIIDDLQIKSKLEKLISDYNVIKESIDEKDEKIYYQKLRSFEKRLKLYDK